MSFKVMEIGLIWQWKNGLNSSCFDKNKGHSTIYCHHFRQANLLFLLINTEARKITLKLDQIVTNYLFCVANGEN